MRPYTLLFEFLSVVTLTSGLLVVPVINLNAGGDCLWFWLVVFVVLDAIQQAGSATVRQGSYSCY